MSLLKYLFLYFLLGSFVYAAIDMNNASKEELVHLKGIGKAKASKIIEYRQKIQCFKSLDELIEIDGISSTLLQKNKSLIILGECKKGTNIESKENLAMKIIFDPVNFIFILIILLLAFLDIWYKKDLKAQIVSVGVLGTFIGIFIGLQSFNPQDIVNSVNDILSGLKTAFLTSIVGMAVATILSIVEKLKGNTE